MKYIELDIVSSRDKRDLLLGLLYDYGQFTIEEWSQDVIDELDQDRDNWDFVDEELLIIKDEELRIKAYPENLIRAKEIKKAVETEKLGHCTILEKDDQDWANNWKAYYKPLEIGEKLAIVPTWEKYENLENRKIISMDPGMAFGTGTHETTELCLEALEKYLSKDDRIFDIGCGSGILGIAACLLGAKEAILVDIDQKSMEASLENAKRNQVMEQISLRKGNLLDVVEGQADLIVSNIIAEIIVDEIKELKHVLVPKGIFITSGIITEKVKLVEDALAKNGFTIVEEREKNGWNVIVAKNL
ncbi:MAG: 50S ribosomal protein L11 methyltransferase [Tissierellia bacterium]|nr:50S ribosomal protein L11 methyltransferase [Tissierellia bacterium]